MNADCCDKRWIDYKFSGKGPLQKNDLCNNKIDKHFVHPMNCISWYQALQYCLCQGKRLPTESEWEKAARGHNDQRQAPWGDIAILSDKNYIANLADSSLKEKCNFSIS